MNPVGFTYWKDGEMFIGYLDEYPDYLTQGETLAELKENLADLLHDFSSDAVPNVRRHAELVIA